MKAGLWQFTMAVKAFNEELNRTWTLVKVDTPTDQALLTLSEVLDEVMMMVEENFNKDLEKETNEAELHSN